MIRPSDIHTLTDFKRNSAVLIDAVETSGRPQILTVEGRPKVVLLGVQAFERLSELADHAEALEGIRRGLADVEAGRYVTLDEFSSQIREKFGFGPRRT